MMNPEIKQCWIEALNSDEYKQTRNKLKDSTGFCCLGVLTDLYIKEHNEEWKVNWCGDYYFGEWSSTLSNEVMNWAGIYDCMGRLNEPVGVGEFDTLAILNDGGYSFKQIAQVIEEQL